MSKQMHIWLFRPSIGNTDVVLNVSLFETSEIIASGADIIHTTLTTFCSSSVLERGYRLFVHFSPECVTEIRVGENSPSGRLIRHEMNLEKLLLAGEFGDVSPSGHTLSVPYENAPLTSDELRKVAGESVWLVGVGEADGWALVTHVDTLACDFLLPGIAESFSVRMSTYQCKDFCSFEHQCVLLGKSLYEHVVCCNVCGEIHTFRIEGD